MRTASVLGMVSIILGCGGGDSAGIDEILYSSVGTWVGTAASGEWLEMTIFTEATGCCYRLASGQGRTAGTRGDTLTVTFFGSNPSTGSSSISGTPATRVSASSRDSSAGPPTSSE